MTSLARMIWFVECFRNFMISLRQVNCTAGGDVSDKRLEKESGISYSTILVLSRNSIGTRPHMSMIRLPSTSPFI